MSKKGELIAKAEPYVHVLAYKEIDKLCSFCFLPCEKLKKCAACGLVKYCGVVCQKADWPIHKTECPCFKESQPIIPTDSVRLFLRIIIRHMEWQMIDMMLSTVTELTKDHMTLPPAHTLFSFFGMMVINTFSICNDDLQPIGSGIYTSPSMLDHSCDPNAVAIFSGKTVFIRALKDIPDTTPNKMFISYIDQLKPSVERLAELEEQYYFSCECSRCLDTDLAEFTDILSQCERNLEKYSNLAEYNIYRVRLLDLAFDSCINLESWKKGLEYGLQTLAPYRKLYPTNTPNLSLQLLKVGKLQLFLEKTDKALKTLQEAGVGIKVSHGTEHNLYRTLSELLAQCHGELNGKT
ncbi:hypothetical protein LOTGIDRAFT_177746 [Lottia gigantea]|uniref:MYND-type domain-containing protein n=1 Tax=Lottia gigantea TaxID=225164 RepID=V4CR88_LOTGI|nr:hypothetical protein LOTGIDRAFT_177746 [Lottia gigantea]ESP05000.1 hypothetical protein LOTGIDRAFT_177746 [Lottia gigantea]